MNLLLFGIINCKLFCWLLNLGSCVSYDFHPSDCLYSMAAFAWEEIMKDLNSVDSLGSQCCSEPVLEPVYFFGVAEPISSQNNPFLSIEGRATVI